MNQFSEIATQAMKCACDREPIEFQLDVVTRIIKMMTFDIDSEPILMMQPTGSGKSTVPLTCACLDGGITIVLENTLSLGADQSMKVNRIANSSNKLNIQSYHLDAINNANHQSTASSLMLKHCNLCDNMSFILFASPETILKPCWLNFVNVALLHDYLKLVRVDETHLFVEHGCSFRSQFQLLKNDLFSKLIIDSNESKIPVLLMTAAFNYEHENLLEKMIGFEVINHSIF